MRYRKLSVADYEEVVALYKAYFGANTFCNKSGDIADDFSEVVTYCLDEGDSRGIEENGNLIGVALAVNYDVVQESMFCKLFGCMSYDDIPGGGTLHNALRKRWFVTYIVSLIGKGYELLISEMKEEFSRACLVADPFDKKLYQSYVNAGFSGIELGENRFYVCSVSGVVPDGVKKMSTNI